MVRTPTARLSLPRRHFKRAPLAARANPKFDNTKTTISAFKSKNFSGQKFVRRQMWSQIAENIVTKTRAAHINATIGYTQGVTGWRQWKAKGQLDGEVAILVDGSPQRPIKNVQFAGRIQIVAPANLDTIIEAVAFAYDFMVRDAVSQPRRTSPQEYIRKKNNQYSYESAFEIFISDDKHVKNLSELARFAGDGGFKAGDWVSIANMVPYASKLERLRYPHSTFWNTFKKLRGKYGSQLSIRFDYVESVQFTQRGTKGKTIQTPIPVIRIGQPGLFPSRAPNIKKQIRDSRKRGNFV